MFIALASLSLLTTVGLLFWTMTDNTTFPKYIPIGYKMTSRQRTILYTQTLGMLFTFILSVLFTTLAII